MTLPFLAQRLADGKLRPKDKTIRLVLDQFARLAADVPELVVELPADIVSEWMDAPGTFMPTIPYEPPPLCWVEYQWPRGRGAQRKGPEFAVPARVGVAFVAIDGPPGSTTNAEKLALDIATNGGDPATVLRTITALVVVWLAEVEQAEPAALMTVAFDGAGEEMGNVWSLLDDGDRRTRRSLAALRKRVADEQIAHQGMPGPVLMSGPAWRVLAAWANKIKEAQADG
jgi:hypothetical protein